MHPRRVASVLIIGGLSAAAVSGLIALDIPVIAVLAGVWIVATLTSSIAIFARARREQRKPSIGMLFDRRHPRTRAPKPEKPEGR